MALKNNKFSLPAWFKKKTAKSGPEKKFRALINNDAVTTVCEEALCPNRGECFSRGQVTFLILGRSCTRKCTFCAVAKGQPEPVNSAEPDFIGAAVKKLQLKYAVVTSVTRDDLPDGGAGQFHQTILKIKEQNPETKVEVLTPDFQGDLNCLKKVLLAGPFVFNHNVETIPRLYPQIRPGADFERSLKILAGAKKLAPKIYTKSGLMLGLGEKFKEVVQVMKKLELAKVDFLTLGQYLQPSSKHAKIRQYILPEEFEKLAQIGREIGFKKVWAGPLVRSSYLAEELLKN